MNQLVKYTKRYSMQFSAAVALAGMIITALTADGYKIPPWVLTVVAVATLILGKVNQTPKDPPTSGGDLGVLGYGAIVLGAALAMGCTKPAKNPVPKYSACELTCLADAEAKKELEFSSCGKNIDGPCATDSIIDRRKVAGRVCFDRCAL